MVIGETEITGQVKNAYQAAQQFGLTGRVLNRWFQTALQVAKEIRTHTDIGRGATSVGSVAVELAKKSLPGFVGQDGDDPGAGKMGEACVRHLAKSGTRSVLWPTAPRARSNAGCGTRRTRPAIWRAPAGVD